MFQHTCCVYCHFYIMMSCHSTDGSKILTINICEKLNPVQLTHTPLCNDIYVDTQVCIWFQGLEWSFSRAKLSVRHWEGPTELQRDRWKSQKSIDKLASCPPFLSCRNSWHAKYLTLSSDDNRKKFHFWSSKGFCEKTSTDLRRLPE